MRSRQALGTLCLVGLLLVLALPSMNLPTAAAVCGGPQNTGCATMLILECGPSAAPGAFFVQSGTAVIGTYLSCYAHVELMGPLYGPPFAPAATGTVSFSINGTGGTFVDDASSCALSEETSGPAKISSICHVQFYPSGLADSDVSHDGGSVLLR